MFDETAITDTHPTEHDERSSDTGGTVHITGRFRAPRGLTGTRNARGRTARRLGEEAPHTSPDRSIAQRAPSLAPTTFMRRVVRDLTSGEFSLPRGYLAALMLCTSACATASDPGTAARTTVPRAEAAASVATSPHGAHASESLTKEQREAIAQMRRATARYERLAVALGEGYTSQYPKGCAASPEGAQGIHYLDPARVDTIIELLRPELVMYEPQRNGRMQLVGVDYVVPFAAWTHAEPPKLLGFPFMRNEKLGVWALHIWNFRDNPSGTFAMWNPRVSCDQALP